MPIEITMPRLSDTMEQGTVVSWHVKVGDSVASGDVIADIETDKATMELQSFDDGTMAKLAVGEGEQVDVGTIIAVLAEEGEDVAKAAASAGASSGAKSASGGSAMADGGSDRESLSSSTSATAVAEPPTATTSGDSSSTHTANSNGTASSNGRVFASPLARKIAEESGVNLGSIAGSGPSGRIVKKDVEAAIAGGGTGASAASSKPTGAASAPALTLPPAGASLEARTVAINNMRTTIAKRLVESKQTIPHYQVTVSARMDAVDTLRGQLNEQLAPQGVKLSVNDFIVRASAMAMHEHPFVNSSWVEGKQPSIQIHGNVNIGVAVALPEERGGGLVVATIRDADRQGLRFISAETKRLAKKAREKGLSIEDMSDSTFTISNLGMFGVDHFTAIINPPNAAILAIGRAAEKPFIEYDDATGEPTLVVGSEMSMTMSSDHRIIDGAMAAQYLQSVKRYLENPATLLV